MADGKACCTPARGEGAASGPAVEVPLAARIDHADGADPAALGLVRLEGGAFAMGSEDAAEVWEADGEGPVREVTVSPLWVDPYAVTNERFAAFVEATGHVTDAERFGWSFVFEGLLAKKVAQRLGRGHRPPGAPWWVAVPGACWRRPEGERSDVKRRAEHPVVQVSWNDAVAYCRWSGTRLPFEAEWEYAARGGRDGVAYPWGDTFEPRGQYRCNTWQGRFPEEDTGADGWRGTCPVDAFQPNGFGLFNVCGNVWEWCADWFDPAWHTTDAYTPVDPRGPDEPPATRGGASPGAGPAAVAFKAQRGGSFLCHASYCNRYRLSARTGNAPDSATSNAGFRVVRDV